MKNKQTYDNFEDELDNIRLELYEQTKDMSASERASFVHEQVADLHAEAKTQQPKSA